MYYNNLALVQGYFCVTLFHVLQPRKRQSEGASEEQASRAHKYQDSHQVSRRWPAGTVPVALLALLFLAGRVWAIDSDPVKSSWWPTQPHSWTDLVLVGITALYLIVTAVYAATSYAQWHVLRDTLSETQRSNNLNLRAWMVIDRISPTYVAAPGPTVLLLITGRIKNVGRLPAFKVQTAQRGKLLAPGVSVESSDEFGPSQGLVYDSQPMFGGGQSHPFDFPIKNLSLEQIEAIVTGTVALWLQVDIAYTDPIKSEGRTDNLIEYVAEAGKFAFRRTSAK